MMSFNKEEDVIEKSGRAHSGLLQIAQTVFSGLVLAVVSIIYGSLHDAGILAIKQNGEIILMQAQLVSLHEEINALHSQLSDVPAIFREVTKNQVKIEYLDRRVNDLEQTRKLK